MLNGVFFDLPFRVNLKTNFHPLHKLCRGFERDAARGGGPKFMDDDLSRFLHYYTWSDGRQRDDVACYTYGEMGDAGDLAPASPTPLCPDRGAEPLSDIEAHRAQASARQHLRDSGAALVTALPSSADRAAGTPRASGASSSCSAMRPKARWRTLKRGMGLTNW